MVLCLLMFISCHLRLAVLFQLDADAQVAIWGLYLAESRANRMRKYLWRQRRYLRQFNARQLYIQLLPPLFKSCLCALLNNRYCSKSSCEKRPLPVLFRVVRSSSLSANLFLHYRNLLSVCPLPTEDTSKEGKVVLNVNLATGRNRRCVITKSHTTCKGVSSDNTHVAATCNYEISVFFLSGNTRHVFKVGSGEPLKITHKR